MFGVLCIVGEGKQNRGQARETKEPNESDGGAIKGHKHSETKKEEGERPCLNPRKGPMGLGNYIGNRLSKTYRGC